MSMGDMYRERGHEDAPFLHGSDVPEKVKSVEIVVGTVRKAAKGFNALCIIDLEKPVYECEAFAINKTNMDILLDKFDLTKENEFSELIARAKGKKLTLKIVMTNNPTTNEPTRGLQIV